MNTVDWLLLGRYAADECTAEERAEVERRIAVSPAYRDAMDALGDAVRQSNEPDPPNYPAAQLRTLHAMIAAHPVAPRRRWWPVAMRVAAAVVLVLGATLLARSLLHTRTPSVVATSPAEHTITTARGQRLSLRLPDGTGVTLAPGSTLKVAKRDNRAVELDGEAAFVVVHDERRPFTVRAGNLVATDLGTEFVVRAYADDRRATVVVREGKVGIGSAVVTPGHMGYLSPRGQPIVEPADTGAAFAWTEGRLVFRRVQLNDAIRQIERWHDVEIRLATPDLADSGFTAVFQPDESPSGVLHAIATMLNLAVEQSGARTYTLRRP